MGDGSGRQKVMLNKSISRVPTSIPSTAISDRPGPRKLCSGRMGLRTLSHGGLLAQRRGRSSVQNLANHVVVLGHTHTDTLTQSHLVRLDLGLEEAKMESIRKL